MPDPFRARIDRGEGVVVLALGGDIGTLAQSRIRTLLTEVFGEPVPADVLLDLTEVTFIDSLSVAAIVAAKRSLGPLGRMAVVAHHPHVLMVFEIAGLDDVINLRDTYDEALAMAIGEQRG